LLEKDFPEKPQKRRKRKKLDITKQKKGERKKKERDLIKNIF